MDLESVVCGVNEKSWKAADGYMFIYSSPFQRTWGNLLSLLLYATRWVLGLMRMIWVVNGNKVRCVRLCVCVIAACWTIWTYLRVWFYGCWRMKNNRSVVTSIIDMSKCECSIKDEAKIFVRCLFKHINAHFSQ